MQEPPAYTSAYSGQHATPRPQRSIASLRAQIIANGSVIRPRTDVNKASDDHIELVVAKTPSSSGAAHNQRGSRLHWASDKEALAACNRGNDPMRARPMPGGSGSGSASSRGEGEGNGMQHYAVLLKRGGGGRSIYVILQGEPRDTVEEALEWMLERTERMCHDLVQRFGKPDTGGTCSIM